MHYEYSLQVVMIIKSKILYARKNLYNVKWFMDCS